MIALPPTTDVSEAWLASLETALAVPGGRVVHLVTTVTQPGTEHVGVRAVLDRALEGAGMQSVDTVTETIFPSSLYPDPGFAWACDLEADRLGLLNDAASHLYECYEEILPLLRTVHANRSGTYFSRMITWPGRVAGGTNQLQLRIDGLRSQQRAGRQRNNTLDIDVAADALATPISESNVDFGGAGELGELAGVQVYAADDRRTRGFPCLTHIDLTLYDGTLHATAVYRHQYLVEKAYGNLMGLSAMLRFLCQQSGYAMGELCVHATMGDAQLSEGHWIRDLARDARAALNQPSSGRMMASVPA
jgi:hypothetical protein